MYIKFCIQVEDTYMCGILKKLNCKGRARSRDIPIYTVFFKEKNTIKHNLASNTDCLIWYIVMYYYKI